MLISEQATLDREKNAGRRNFEAHCKRRIRAARKALGQHAEYASWIWHDKTGQEPDKVFYTCRDEGTTWSPTSEECRPDNWNERIPGSGFEVKGVRYELFRWQSGFSYCHQYEHTPQHLLDERAVRRRERKLQAAIEAERRHLGLFASQLEEEDQRE